MPKIDVIAAGALPAKTQAALAEAFAVTRLDHDEPIPPNVAAAARGLARGNHFPIDRGLIESLPKLEIIANFGVGYDGIDLKAAAERGIVVTNTPDVLTEEVADTALGLLLMTVRELSAAERHLRAGKWASEGGYPLTPATLRDRTVGIVGLGRIGMAIARRLDAMQVPVVYHNRHKRDDVPYRYFADLTEMAAGRRHADRVLPGGGGNGQPDRRRGPQGARAERRLHQYRPRQRRRRAGADRRAQGRHDPWPPDSTSSPTSRTCRRN